jgi:hypothetical protein
VALGELFTRAATAMHNAQILSQAMTLAAQSQTGTVDAAQPVVDQAIGLVWGHSVRGAEGAHCGRWGHAEHRPLAEVTHRLIDEAVPAPDTTQPERGVVGITSPQRWIAPWSNIAQGQHQCRQRSLQRCSGVPA